MSWLSAKSKRPTDATFAAHKAVVDSPLSIVPYFNNITTDEVIALLEGVYLQHQTGFDDAGLSLDELHSIIRRVAEDTHNNNFAIISEILEKLIPRGR